jgi:colicin import membrane protein
MGKESIQSMEAGNVANQNLSKDFTGPGHIHTNIAAGPYNGEEVPITERLAADHARAAAQLKAEHAKELAILQARKAQLKADLKAEHAMTAGGTGLIAKLKGTEDPVKRAEKKQLKAEIARLEQTMKAAHQYEDAELKAKREKDNAAFAAAERFTHSSYNNNNGVATGAMPAGGTAYSNAGAMPGGATAYNAGAMPSGATAYNAGAMSSGTTAYNAGAMPVGATPYNTSAMPAGATSYNTASTIPVAAPYQQQPGSAQHRF